MERNTIHKHVVPELNLQTHMNTNMCIYIYIYNIPTTYLTHICTYVSHTHTHKDIYNIYIYIHVYVRLCIIDCLLDCPHHARCNQPHGRPVRSWGPDEKSALNTFSTWESKHSIGNEMAMNTIGP